MCLNKLGQICLLHILSSVLKMFTYLFIYLFQQGEGAPIVRKGTCANHIRDVSNILKGAHVTINARNDDEVDTDIILSKVSKSSASTYSFKERLDQSQPQDKIVIK